MFSSKIISNWEREVAYPDVLLIPKLCKILEIPINLYFNGQDIKGNNGIIEQDYNQINTFRKSKIKVEFAIRL